MSVAEQRPAGATEAPGDPPGRAGRIAAFAGRSLRWWTGPAAPYAVGLLTLWAIVLRTRNIEAPFWIDEGISVGIAHFPFFDIPSALQLDGNPPVYYLLLHVWLRVFGDTVTAAHALSGLFAIATIPAVYLLARRSLGRRAAVGGAVVAATLPYLTYYAQETRMYALVAFLALLVGGLHLRLYEPRARAAPIALAVVLIVLLYTHTWGVFLVGGSVLAVGARALVQPDRAARRRVVRIGFLVHLAAAIAWLPWIPSLIRQAQDTGAPWSLRPTLTMLLDGLGSIASPAFPSIVFFVALAFAGGLLVAAGEGRFRGPSVAPPAQARALRDHALVLAVMIVSTLLFAYAASLLSPAWANRYLGVIVGPMLLLAGLLLTRTGRVPLAALLLLAAIWGTSTQGSRLQHKAAPTAMVEAVAHELRPGDLVVSIHPEQLPVIVYDLRKLGVPDGVRYATALGRQQDTRLFDWRHAMDRLQAATPWRVADRLIRAQRPGSSILLVLPVLSSGNWQGPWTRLVADRSRAWRVILQADPRLRMVGRRPVIGPGSGVFGVLFTVAS